MLFIHPMWDHESQRVGKQKCTPAGYALHIVADYIGLLGLLLLFGMPALLVWRWLFSTFHWSLLWLLAVPFGVGIVSEFVPGLLAPGVAQGLLVRLPALRSKLDGSW